MGLGEKITEAKCPSHHITQGDMSPTGLITEDVTRDHLGQGPAPPNLPLLLSLSLYSWPSWWLAVVLVAKDTFAPQHLPRPLSGASSLCHLRCRSMLLLLARCVVGKHSLPSEALMQSHGSCQREAWKLSGSCPPGPGGKREEKIRVRLESGRDRAILDV